MKERYADMRKTVGETAERKGGVKSVHTEKRNNTMPGATVHEGLEKYLRAASL